MQYYIYQARTPENKVITGKVQAASVESAKKILKQNKLLPLSITSPKRIEDFIPFIGKISLKDKTIFARQLSTMLTAGLTLNQSLGLLMRQTRSGQYQNVLTAILNDIQDGFSFSSAIAKHPDVFDSIFINVIKSGEATGKLEMVLNQVAGTMEKDVELRSKIKGALFYPVFVMIVMVAVALVMTTQVIPQLKDVFDSSGQELPNSTKSLIFLSDTLISHWYIYLGVVIGVITGVRAFFRTSAGMELYSKYALKVPIAGTIIRLTSMARFGRLLALLLDAGVPILECLRLVRDGYNNKLYRRSIAQVAAQVEAGAPMSVPINANPLFPPLLAQMVAVGEQTGNMSEVMYKVAEYYENEAETKIGSISTLIEPVIIVILGVGVAWLVIAILLPIYQISTTI